MKKVLLLVLASCVFAALASAAITPALVNVTPSGTNPGDFTWNYQISVDNLEQLVAGNYSTCQGGAACGTFFTIYDFAGYVPGSAAAPTGWAASVQFTGVTANNQNPADNPGVPNITYIYTGPPATQPGPIVNQTGFHADSIYGTANPNGVFTYQAQKIANPTQPDAGIGPINVPMNSVPEPASLALIGGGLIGLAALRRKLAR